MMVERPPLPGALLRRAGFRGEIREQEPLAPYTTWRIGGPAEILATPEDRDDLLRAIGWAHARGVPWRVLGNGSNLLVSDRGVRGLVLRIRKNLGGIRVEGRRITAEGGALLAAVAGAAAAAGLAGMEFAAGIPGTVGGAVIMNAGWHEHEIGNRVESVEYLERNGSVVVYPRVECAFGYRGSLFRGRGGVVVSATLKLQPGDPEELRRKIETFAESRKAKQPTELPSCGSVFLKPEGDFAGRLIEQAGLKGLRVGDIQVSPKHANFFVNLGRGTARDALALVERVEREVRERFGVTLTREFEQW